MRNGVAQEVRLNPIGKMYTGVALFKKAASKSSTKKS